MERRRALAIAAATAATTVGAVVAIAANFGLLGFGQAPSTSVGKLEAGRVAQVGNPAETSPTTADASPKVTIRYEDVYEPAPAGQPPSSTPATRPEAQPAPSAPMAGDPGTVPGVDGARTGPADDAWPRESDNGDDHPDDDHEHDGGVSEDDD